MNAVIRFALNHRPLILGLCILALVYGGMTAATMPIDVFPDLDRPRVVLLVECPGLAPEEIEQQVTQPIETAILGANGVRAVRSQSGQALVVIYVEFDWTTETRAARQIVNERLPTVSLPPGIKPHLTPPASIMGQILHVGVSWKPNSRPGKTDLQNRLDIRTLADSVIRPRLLQRPGVAEVIVLGGDRKQYQVLLDTGKLLDYGVTLREVKSALEENNANASGGLLDDGVTEKPVRVIGRLGPAPAQVLDDLRKIPVRPVGERPLLLAQVAEPVEGPAPKRGDASIDGATGVLLTIVKQPHADTRAITQDITRTLDAMTATLPHEIVITTELFQLKAFIDRGVFSVEEALVIGAGLVVIVLFLFLLNLRTTVITLTAIPLSLAITAIVFRLIGTLTGTELSINVMTLGGLAVAMGELVDDAIVDVENIFRRLNDNARLAQPRPKLLVVYDASREIRSAIVFGTAVVILAFVPLFALSGIEGRLFIPLGLAYIISILASLVVSLTLTPVLSYYLLGRAETTHRESILLKALKWIAAYLIRFSLNHAGKLLILSWVVVGLCGWQLSRLGADFLPKFDEGSVQINVALPGNSSLSASNEAAALIDARLKSMQVTPEQPGAAIRHFVRRTGRAELDEHAEPVNRSEYILTMNPNSTVQRDEFLRTLLADLRREVPGVEFDAEQPLAHLISHMLSGVTAQIAVKIHGDDLDRLREIAQQVHRVVSSVPGATLPVMDPQERVDEVHIVLRPDDLALYGLSRDDVSEVVQIALKGEAVSTVYDGPRRFDLVLKLRDDQRQDLERLGELRINLPQDRQIRLKDVADFPPAASGPNLINRENVRRLQTVRCNVSGRDLASTVAEIEARVKAIALPEGYSIELGGQFEAQRSATRTIAVLAVVSLLGMFLTLLVLFPSSRISLQILNAVPTAFIGGVIALSITRQSLTVASLVGFVSLGGIAVRNGILLVSHYIHLMKSEGEGFTREMILRGSLERLAPVLMTALTAGIGLLPLVLGGRQPGREILYPVATVILGGLITSTFCEFLLHPGLFWKFSGHDAERIAATSGTDSIPSPERS